MTHTVQLQHVAKIGILTTDHAASSYGQPVLIVDGITYGPGDIIDSHPLAIWPPEAAVDVADVFAALLAEGAYEARVAARRDADRWNLQVAQAYGTPEEIAILREALHA